MTKRNDPITLEAVMKAVEELGEEGTKITIRAVHGKVGGSLTTVSRHLRGMHGVRTNSNKTDGTSIRIQHIAEEAEKQIRSEISQELSRAIGERDLFCEHAEELEEALDSATERLRVLETSGIQLNTLLNVEREKNNELEKALETERSKMVHSLVVQRLQEEVNKRVEEINQKNNALIEELMHKVNLMGQILTGLSGRK